MTYLISYLFPGFVSWIGPAIGLAGTLLSDGGSGSGSGSGGGGASGGGSSSPQYVPTGLGAADQGWQNAFNSSGWLARNAQNQAGTYYDQSLNNSANINYGNYLNSATQAGQSNWDAGNLAFQQRRQYEQAAQQAQGQQQGAYDRGARVGGGLEAYGNQVANTAFDPQNALFNQTQQTLQDQVRQGQAARGLGNSAQGSGEENQAMSNFDIAWQNNQLQRQTQGLAANANAQNAGTNAYNSGQNAGMGQGRLYGADQSAALAAQGAAGGYYQQGGQIPLQAQQYAAAGPGQAAAQYQAQQSGLQGMYGNAQSGVIPYLNQGQGAQQGNYANNTAQNAANGQMFSQLGTAIAPKVASWFAGNNSSGSGQNNRTAYGSDPQPYMPDYNNYTPTY